MEDGVRGMFGDFEYDEAYAVMDDSSKLNKGAQMKRRKRPPIGKPAEVPRNSLRGFDESQEEVTAVTDSNSHEPHIWQLERTPSKSLPQSSNHND
jgi:hypothetical protein